MGWVVIALQIDSQVAIRFTPCFLRYKNSYKLGRRCQQHQRAECSGWPSCRTRKKSTDSPCSCARNHGCTRRYKKGEREGRVGSLTADPQTLRCTTRCTWPECPSPHRKRHCPGLPPGGPASAPQPRPQLRWHSCSPGRAPATRGRACFSWEGTSR